METCKVAKVVEIVGCSNENWTHAADIAVRIASKTIKNITGVEVQSMTATVKDAKIMQFKTTVKVAFGVSE